MFVVLSVVCLFVYGDLIECRLFVYIIKVFAHSKSCNRKRIQIPPLYEGLRTGISEGYTI